MAVVEALPNANHQSESRDGGSPATPVLSFKGVTLQFDGRAVLDNISFSVDAGQTRVIMGAAGAGKTLLLKNAIGLLCPDLGSVRLLGHEITHLGERQLYRLRRHVGVLFQEGALFDSLTVAENVAYPLRYQPDRVVSEEAILNNVTAALKFVGLSRIMDKYPSQVSGGMR
ncbi:MAG TPA: ATP-binding cassette domain-containing protein, partial [Candidatus Acidoferrum sp.]|nr:ATP-binding cassette domain-containing protein [Candidatus Acidoferrum sp.]